jgi:hypothetical protein
MQQKPFQRRTFMTALVPAVAVLFLLPSLPAFARNSQTAEGRLISITAGNTPLSQVLDRVCTELDITCTSLQQLSDPVTAELQEIPPEEALQLLLADWNSVFIYDRNQSDSLRKISVLSKKRSRRPQEESTVPATLTVTVTQSENPPKLPATLSAGTEVSQTSNPAAAEKRGLYGAGVFLSPDRQALQQLDEELFHEDLGLENASLAIPAILPSGAPAPQKYGVRVSAVTNDLLRDGLGLREGDVVREINGWPVDDPVTFISKITEAIADSSTTKLRLEVEREEDASAEEGSEGKIVIQPIYIDLDGQ